jgi:hypothetical protein
VGICASGAGVADLHREIRRCQRGVQALHHRRARVLAKIAEIDTQIRDRAGTIAAEAGLTARGTGRTRPKNDTNLIDALRAVLKGKTMGVSEAAEAAEGGVQDELRELPHDDQHRPAQEEALQEGRAGAVYGVVAEHWFSTVQPPKGAGPCSRYRCGLHWRPERP